MIIYINGDSFTAGDGLGDHAIFPTFPGTLGLGDNPRTWASWRDTLLTTDKELADLSIAENKKRSWAAQLANHTTATIINNAVGGSSMFGIYSRTVSDITSLIKNNIVPDVVLIGLTSDERVSFINRNPMPDNNRFWVHVVVPACINHVGTTHRKYAKSFWESHSDEELLTLFLYTCFNIKTYVNSVINKDPIFINTSHRLEMYEKIVNESNIFLLKELWELLRFDTVAMHPSIQHMNGTRPILPCGHVEASVHVEFAKYIYENILNKV